MTSQNYELGYKFIILGNDNVGKTSMVNKICDNINSNGVTTIGIEFRSTQLTIDGKKCKLYIWDTSGRSSFEELVVAHIKDRDGIILCFDTSDPETFLRLDYWKQLIDQYKPSHATVLLVGTKNDLVREVAYEQGEKYALANKWNYVEISSTAESANVLRDKTFGRLCKTIYTLYPHLKSEIIAKANAPMTPASKDSYAFDFPTFKMCNIM